MINTIYLVKKDVNKPYSQENWLMMNVKEFNAFVKPPDARGRYFADVGGHEYDDIWYIVECPKENAIKWRKEFNRHYYLKRTERESGYQTVSYHNLMIEDEEINGEELISDIDDDFAAEIMHKIDLKILEQALNTLSDSDYDLIYALFLAEITVTEQEYAVLQGITQQAIHKRKSRILQTLKQFF